MKSKFINYRKCMSPIRFFAVLDKRALAAEKILVFGYVLNYNMNSRSFLTEKKEDIFAPAFKHNSICCASFGFVFERFICLHRYSKMVFTSRNDSINVSLIKKMWSSVAFMTNIQPKKIESCNSVRIHCRELHRFTR